MTNWHTIYSRLLSEKVPNPISLANCICEKKLDVESVLKTLKTGCPIEYILGEVDFFGAKILVNPSVLIPRSETEILTDLVSKQIQMLNHTSKKLLDICTGSGCIAISLKKKYPFLTTYAVDVCDKALEVAKKNAQMNHVEVIFLQGDLLNPVFQEKFDFVVSNPPYISKEEYDVLDLSVRGFEPKKSLTDENDGLTFYKRLESSLPHILNKGAKIFFEIGYNQKMPLFKIFSSPIWTKQQCLTDYAGHDRFFSLEYGG